VEDAKHGRVDVVRTQADDAPQRLSILINGRKSPINQESPQSADRGGYGEVGKMSTR
jgi:hypothetical protein